jgi:hypothetical protein
MYMYISDNRVAVKLWPTNAVYYAYDAHMCVCLSVCLSVCLWPTNMV